MRILLALLLCFSALFSATAKDSIVIAVENEAELINPVFSEDHDVAIGLIFSGLIRFDENMQVKPDLAKSWKISKDGLKYDFTLRENVLWHDGKKFSAQDVKFTLQALLDSKINAPSRVNFEAIKEIKILDDSHLSITLSYPFPAFLDALNIGIVPKHLLQGEDFYTTSFNQNPIGTGPYKFASRKKGQHIILEANEKFYLQKVKTKNLILRHISDSTISAIELKKGNVDVSLVGFDFVKDFQNDKDFQVIIEKSADYRALGFSQDDEILKDKNVRKALNHLIKKDSIVETLLHGYGEVAHHPLQRSWASPKNYPTYDFNPKKADKLLKKAGFVKKDGFYQKDGKKLSFEMYAMSGDSLRVALITLLQAEFQKYGIDAKAIAKPSGSFAYDEVQSALLGWGSPYDADFHTYRVFGYVDGVRPDWNFSNYKNDKVSKSLKQARSTNNKAQRKKEYAKFINALHEDPPFLFLVYLDFPLVANKEIKGIKTQILGHHGVGFTWNAYEWSK